MAQYKKVPKELIEVIAPATLSEGYTFRAIYHGEPVTVIVVSTIFPF